MGTARNCVWKMPAAQNGENKPEAASSVCSPLLGQILCARGIASPGEQAEFLSDRPGKTYDPFLLNDMEAAVKRMMRALEQEEKICIFGDYDADGVTSTVLLLSVLEKLTENLTYYIPSRFAEGYGLNADAVRKIAQSGVKLLVTVDCGSLSREEVRLAQELGVDVIVTDHHSIGKEPAADCLLINPKRAESTYPFSELSGCGVAFKLAQALQRKLAAAGDQRLLRSDITDTLDLVAVSTIGDIVALTDENRSLVKYGLNVLNQGKRAGMRALIAGTGLRLGAVTSEQVAYVLVPHLNAAGRMGSADKGVELLRGHEGAQQETLVQFLVENNKERKRVQEEMFHECRRIAEQEHGGELFQVIYAPQAHEGIAGIVAGKLKDESYRPTIIVTPSGEGKLKGTGRSIPGVDLHRLLSAHRELFLRFGGHKGACGFLMEADGLDELRRGLNAELAQMAAAEPALLTEVLTVEAVAEPREITMELAMELAKLEPFGQQNPKPIFAVRNVEIQRVSFMGSEEQHARFYAAGSKSGSAGFDCVLFSHAQEYRALLREGNVADVAGYPSVNTWNGISKIQFVIEDIK